jgi:hypothetical protein
VIFAFRRQFCSADLPSFLLKRFSLHNLSSCGFLARLINMAKLISGNDISKELRDEIKAQIDQIRAKPEHANFTPGLAIVQVSAN